MPLLLVPFLSGLLHKVQQLTARVPPPAVWAPQLQRGYRTGFSSSPRSRDFPPLDVRYPARAPYPSAPSAAFPAATPAAMSAAAAAAAANANSAPSTLAVAAPEAAATITAVPTTSATRSASCSVLTWMATMRAGTTGHASCGGSEGMLQRNLPKAAPAFSQVSC